jgi:hypothetical protein
MRCTLADETFAKGTASVTKIAVVVTILGSKAVICQWVICQGCTFVLTASQNNAGCYIQIVPVVVLLVAGVVLAKGPQYYRHSMVGL